jgi:hypothetical protein
VGTASGSPVPKQGWPGEVRTVCLKGKKTAPEKPGNYKCKKCGATAKDKGKLCDPKKIKDKGD